MKHEEVRNQIMTVAWFKRQYPKFKNLIYCIPNGVTANVKKSTRMRKLGISPGIPRLHFAWPVRVRGTVLYHSLYVEILSLHGKLNCTQERMQTYLKEAGHKVETAYTFQEAQDILRAYIQIPITPVCLQLQYGFID